ncbi:HNH endonuclease signature motif containing protein [Pseudonocardia spinosispora]|uniref:HNH endonuclease signature motif containing protein n=1 Tax=Pseudonocardia spinosispora TaxID=103441 RepID=UPI00146F98BA|nr:HNH endonuclease signature motif containing protein [Pseudonocardia spinosispora]
MQGGVSVGSWLAGMPAGPVLGAVLSALDMNAVSDDFVVDVLQACGRQRAHVEGLYAAAVTTVVQRGSVVGSEQYASDEVRAALTLSRNRARTECDFAQLLCLELPAVHAAMVAGLIDRDRAMVFTHYLAGLPDDLIAAVIARVLPVAPGLTTGQLRARILKLIITVEPERAEDQYEQALADRMVVGYLDSAGTATITATGLPPDEAAAATERIAKLALAAKRAGHRGRIDQLRADIFLRLLDGRFHHLTHAQMIAALLAETSPHSPAAELVDAELVDTEPADAEPVDTEPVDAELVDAESVDVESGDAESGGEESAEAVAEVVGRVSGIEVRARLDTLAGLNNLPGELPGWGPILGSVARRAAARQHSGQWRWVVTDADGYLMAEGITRRRPTTSPPGYRAEGGIVELAIPVTALAKLAKDPPRAWVKVITDIAAQYQLTRERNPAERLDTQPGRRHPTSALRRYTQIRDRTCTAPGCRRSAVQSELDHTYDIQHGGPTTSTNLAPACAHDHALKHRGGWTVTQPRPGYFRWKSPLGRTYPTRGEPITDSETDEDPAPF